MIPLAEPNLTGKEKEYVADAISSGWVGPDGPYVERFEEMVAKAAGRKWAVATTTGTMALYAAIVAMRLEPSTMHVPYAAFPAAANMFKLLGWEVKNIGRSKDHDTQFYGPICDRAPAIGEPKTAADLECYSFAANKIVTCGHGGAVAGDDGELKTMIRLSIAQHRGKRGGNNGRMANLNAAVGCAQMERLDEFKEKKRRIWNRYAEAGLPMVERGASRWMATVDIQHKFPESSIGVRAEGFGISLPCSTNLTEADQDKVIKCVKSLL